MSHCVIKKKKGKGKNKELTDEEVNPNLDVYIYWGLKKRLEDARTMMPNNQEQMLVETEPKPKFLPELVLVLSELANKVE